MTFINEAHLTKRLKKLSPDAHKGDNGFLNIVAGSVNYRGAADLCVGGALRTGVGIVRLLSDECVISAVATRHPTCTFLPFDLTHNTENAISSLKQRCFLVGCGLGISDTARAKVNAVLSCAEKAVIDADALNIISLNPEMKAMLSGHIITPHIGEFSRLTGLDTTEIKRDPQGYALDYAKKHGCTVVLKDFMTVIATPSGNIFISKDIASEGLSKGGSGDVLAGLIAGFLAQNYSAEDSAIIGVTLHALSSRLCAEEMGARSMLPSDLEHYVARALQGLGY